MVFLPKNHSGKPAMIVELKWDKSADTAINQIKDRKYTQALEHYTGEILLVGINYNKKTKKYKCYIERIQKGTEGSRDE